MKYLFFDIECANCSQPWSIYSIGYTIVDKNFKYITEPTNLYTYPTNFKWNKYVKNNILDISMDELKNCPSFLDIYEELCALFENDDTICLGFSVNNDNRFLYFACKNLNLRFFNYCYIDCQDAFSNIDLESNSLQFLIKKWCKFDDTDLHNSSSDANYTMLLIKSFCNSINIDLEKFIIDYCKINHSINCKYKLKKPH